MKNKAQKQAVIYQAKSGKIEFRGDLERDTIWGNLNQIAELFGRDKSVISRHIKNIFKAGELEQHSVVAKIATTATDGKTYQVEYYNLDMILSVGYRVDSRQATQFRIWATKTLKQHLLDGYTINKKRISGNYRKFMRAVADIKTLSAGNDKLANADVLELVGAFAGTWFSLDAYDKQQFPQKGLTRKTLTVQARDLYADIAAFKAELMRKGEATELFAQEKSGESLNAILGNVFQSAFGKEAYPSIEEKAAHLLYFTVKNHPFNDGNKRAGAFAFVWFLQKAKLRFQEKITAQTLTALTLLIAESDPKEKEKIIGLVLLLLKK
ncbi:MAG: virulence protein RhuM/Fic/DOC family protein [Gammaproteobacteria bacterium]|nr:virulence protein RhuM/Fic/DOC family protein [Gammaproteobacteria bacterium]